MSASIFSPAMAEGARRLWCSSSCHRSLGPTTKDTMRTVKFVTISRNPYCGSGTKRSFQVRASDRRSEQPRYGAAGETQGGSDIKEDLSFLWKLGAGSLAAAAAIKYGSILFPEITKPNIVVALFMILTPVVVSIVLLIRGSHLKNQNSN